MTDHITVTGIVATVPKHVVTGEGLPITTFRMASTQRRFDRKNNEWVDAETNWYTISSFRQLAANAAGSLTKGQRVLVSGRLRIREWGNDDKRGTSVDIEADSIGHDLAWGTSTFARVIVASATDPAAPDARASESSPESPSESSVASQDSVPVPF